MNNSNIGSYLFLMRLANPLVRGQGQPNAAPAHSVFYLFEVRLTNTKVQQNARILATSIELELYHNRELVPELQFC